MYLPSTYKEYSHSQAIFIGYSIFPATDIWTGIALIDVANNPINNTKLQITPALDLTF